MVTVLSHPSAVTSTSALEPFLSHLGVAYSTMAHVGELARMDTIPDSTSLACPFAHLPTLLGREPHDSSLMLPRSIKRVFFHSYSPKDCAEDVVRSLLHDLNTRLVDLESRPIVCRFSDDTHFCGPLSGLTIRSSDPVPTWGVRGMSPSGSSAILSSNDAVPFLRLNRDGLEIYLLFTATLPDLGQAIHSNLDVRECVFSIAAPLMALKSLARDHNTWTCDNYFANVIVDDPPLGSRYGCLDFPRLARRVTKQQLCFTLAYIPWNYKRGGPDAVQLIRETGDRITLCIHGCNHTSGEFGTDDRIRLNGLASLACRRMSAMTVRTGIPYGRIMVFPQGVLSATAMQALKQNDYLAAVNTEVEDVTREYALTLRDLLQPAITAYHGLPLFLRRKVTDGIENIAFDLLLGKPALIVTHHNDYRSDDAAVWQLTDAICHLHRPPDWRPLSHVVSNTLGYRDTSEHGIEATLYSTATHLSRLPSSWQGRVLHVSKHEPEPELLKSVTSVGQQVSWEAQDARIHMLLAAGWHDGEVRLAYRQANAPDIHFGMTERLRVGARLALREFRDYCVATSPALERLVARLRRRRARATDGSLGGEHP